MLQVIAIGLTFSALGWLIISTTWLIIFDPKEEGLFFLLFWFLVAVVYAGFFSHKLLAESDRVAIWIKALATIVKHTSAAILMVGGVVFYMLLNDVYHSMQSQEEKPAFDLWLTLWVMGCFFFFIQMLWSAPLYLVVRFVVKPLVERYDPGSTAPP